MGAVDDFLGGLDEAARAAFDPLVAEVRAEVPDAEQSTSYGVAAFRHRGKPLLGFAASRAHLSLFPFSPAAVDAARPLLQGFSLSKGTVRFAADHPLPPQAVRTMLRTRIAEIDAAVTPRSSR
jgi:uncharacterized protein YdhG (YjbR/CyaY superfamily)